MSTITIQTEGRRHYLVGDTYPIKSAIRAAGCKWDADKGAWWTGKRETAEALAAKVRAGAVKARASYTKLDDGSWGVRVPGAVVAGSTVEVETKSGRVSTETIAAIVRVDGDRTICSIVQRARTPRYQRDYGDGRSYRRSRDYNQALRNYRATGDYYGSGLYDEES